MKILHVIPSLRKGGAERLCLDTVEALRKLPGVEAADVAVLENVNEYDGEYPDIKPLPVASKVVPSLSGKWTVDLREWDALTDRYRPDVIHTHLFAADLLARYRPLPGVKYLSHCHDNMHQLSRLTPSGWFSKKRITEWYERRFMLDRYARSANTFLAISRDTEAYFRKNLPPALAARVKYLPNAIDVARFSAHSAQYVPDTVLRLINIGSFTPKKNQAFLVKVLARLIAEGTDATLTFAGEGPLKTETERLAKEYGLEHRTVFPGRTSDIERQLWQHHVYVHGATYEPFGLVLLEAMAAGLPVVCVDGKGNRGLVDDGINGYMVEAGDIRTFTECVRRVTAGPEEWERMSRAAGQKAGEFDIKKYVETLSAVYREAPEALPQSR